MTDKPKNPWTGQLSQSIGFGLERVLALVLGCGVLVSMVIAWEPLVRTYLFSSYTFVTGVHPEKPICQIGVTKDPQTLGGISWETITMPLPPTRKIKIDLGEFLVTVCNLDLTKKLSHESPGWIFMDSLTGKSLISINDQFRYFIANHGHAAIYLSPAEISQPITLKIVSERIAKDFAQVGPRSFDPILTGNNPDTLASLIKRRYDQRYGINTSRINLLFGLVLTLGVAWLFGMHYGDIAWIIVVLGGIALQSVKSMQWESLLTDFGWRQYQLTYCLSSFGIMGFLMAFLREKKKEVRFTLLFIPLVFSAVFICYTIEHTWNVGRTYFIPTMNLIQSFALFTGFIAGYRLTKIVQGQRKLKVQLFMAATLLTGILSFSVGFGFYFGFGFLSVFIQQSIGAVFAVLLGLDLVLFQRNFLSERKERLKFEGVSNQLTEQMTSGQLIQHLLVPPKVNLIKEHFKFFYSYVPYVHIAGDWMTSWHAGTRFTVLTGDVSGKGVPAAIAMASIMGGVNEAVNRLANESEALVTANRVLLETYQKKMMSTWSGFSLDTSGHVWVGEGGGIGWLVWNGSKLKLIQTRNQLLGTDELANINWHHFNPKEWTLLVSFSDGIATDSRTLRRIVTELDAMIKHNADYNRIEAFLYQEGEKSGIKDDKSVVIVENRLASKN